MISIPRLVKSFRYAWNGLRVVIREEQNFRIHMVAGLIVFIAAIWFRIEPMEWVSLIIVAGLVMMAEMVNTIFERIVDVLKPRIHPFAEVIKDMMAAMVVLAVCVSVLVGIIIFLPRLLVYVL